MTRVLSRPMIFGFALLASSCETADPTRAVLVNRYELSDLRGSVTVYKAWWSVAAFLDPIPPGVESAPVRIVKGTDFGYALLAPGWDPRAGAPVTLIPVRTRSELTVKRGETLHILIAPGTIDGDCATGRPLAQEDADFITERIFPREFSGVRYDAATCSEGPNEGGAGGSANEFAAGETSGNGGNAP